MNKPAPKEPSMDEILSSIRQIIADDDAAAAPRRPAARNGCRRPFAAARRLAGSRAKND
jgi:cell pole-organizing protein PopZ